MKLNNKLSKSLNVCYNYCKEHKWIVILIAILIVCLIFGIVTYTNHIHNIKIKQQTELTNRYIIKRNFQNLKLGDSTEDAILNIPSPYPREITYTDSVVSQISVENVYLGKRIINEMELYFYKDKLYLLIMYINITFEDFEDGLTFNHFHNLFVKNGYRHNPDGRFWGKWRDYYFERSINLDYQMKQKIDCFSDKHTDLVLVNTYITPGQPQLIMRYYDKDSHYTEDKKKEYETLDTAFVSKSIPQ